MTKSSKIQRIIVVVAESNFSFYILNQHTKQESLVNLLHAKLILIFQKVTYSCLIKIMQPLVLNKRAKK